MIGLYVLLTVSVLATELPVQCKRSVQEELQLNTLHAPRTVVAATDWHVSFISAVFESSVLAFARMRVAMESRARPSLCVARIRKRHS